ncbi:putative cell survival pathways protein [Coemansia erecta]|nr:putative cell survival pathways protein [Coemansia erecta]
MPYNVGAEWNMVYFIGYREGTAEDQKKAANSFTYNVLQYETPANAGSVNCSNASLTESSKLKAVLWDTIVEHFDEELDPNGSGYEIPKRLVYTSVGKTTDGKKIKVTFDTNPAMRLHDIDVLHEMPYVIRRLVQALITKPFVFERYDGDSKVVVEIEGEEPFNVYGVSFNELTLMK